jgi:hypothetical protein
VEAVEELDRGVRRGPRIAPFVDVAVDAKPVLAAGPSR